MQLPFMGETYNGRSRAIDPSRCINFYPEISIIQDTKTNVALVGTPGVKKVAYLGGLPIRGIYSFNKSLYCVCGSMLYSIDANYNVTYLGNLSTNYGNLSFADNGLSKNGVGGDQLAITDGLHLYIYNVSTQLLSVVYGSSVPIKPITVTYMDSYFILSNGSMRFDVSNSYEGTTFTGLAFASAVGVPDNIQTTVNSHQVLFVIKQYSTELFYNNGTATTLGCPFVRYPNAVMDFGTIARNSVARGDGSIFMLGTQRVNNDTAPFAGIVEMTQGGATIISKPPINYRISQLTRLDDATAYCYADEGHLFYVITFPSDNVTLVYDSHSKMFHERSTYTTIDTATFDNNGVVTSNMTLPVTTNRHLSSCYSNFNRKHLVGDYRVGNIYEMSSDYVDDAGEPIVSIRTASPIYDKNELANIFVSKLIVDASMGNSDTSITTTSQYPAAYLSWSNDGGYNWSMEYPCSLGKSGEYNTRLVWRRLGHSKDKVFKLRMSEPSRKILLNAYIEGSV